MARWNKNHMPYDEVISSRVTARQKKLLEDSNYTLRDVVDFYINHSVSPKKRLLIDKFFIQESIDEVKDKIEDMNIELFGLEKSLEEINAQLGIVELNGKEYSLEVYTAVDNIIQRYNYSKLDIETYFETNHLFVENQAAVVNLDVSEMEDLVRGKLSKQT